MTCSWAAAAGAPGAGPAVAGPPPGTVSPGLPVTARRTLASGLTVMAVQRSTVPLAEIRLRIPLPGLNPARTALLAQTLLAGTDDMSGDDLTGRIQLLGGYLAVAADGDQLRVSGNVLAGHLDDLLGLLGQVLTGAAYPAAELVRRRDQLAVQARAARCQPAFTVLHALNKRLYGRHPYADQSPDPDQILAVTRGDVVRLHRDRIRPGRASLIIAGNVSPEAALDSAEQALSGWDGAPAGPGVPPMPALPPQPNPVVLAAWPGAGQALIRLALPALGRTAPGFPALYLANLVYGGYFSSRLMASLREERGLAYAPRSRFIHLSAGSLIVVFADVPAAAAAAALSETWRQMERLSSAPPEPAELDRARSYGTGSLRVSLASQASLADSLASLAGDGLDLDWVDGHLRRLATVTAEEVQAAAARYLRPPHATAVVLGDPGLTEASLSSLGDVLRC